MTSPLNAHLALSNKILISLLENTDFAYHSNMAASIMQMIEAFYQELKSMKQEPYKKKILQKLCNAISLLMGYSNAGTCHELIKKQH